MIAKIKALDDWLIEVVQAGYLWLYDRTGIYVATINVILAVAAFLMGHVSTPILCMLALLIASFIPKYIEQDKRAFVRFNAHARYLRSSWARGVCTVIILATAAIPNSIGDGLSSLLLLFGSGYVSVIQIRDREPKDFFAHRQPATAGAAS